MKPSIRPRTARSYSRRDPVRQSKKCILIVSEGAKTEPNYFESLKNYWRLVTADVRVLGQGASPSKVVERAVRERGAKADLARRNQGLEYDEAWCVVDRDRHKDLEKAKAEARKENIRFILSTPCFEIWFLLHFKYSTSPFNTFQELLPRLKRCIPDYCKASNCFATLLPKLDTALSNAWKLRTHNKRTGSNNPATDVDLLVTELQKMAGELSEHS